MAANLAAKRQLLSDLVKKSTAAELRAVMPLSRAAPARPSSRHISTTIPSYEAAKTGLHAFHVRNEGKMVNFGGYDMPLSYGNVGQGM